MNRRISTAPHRSFLVQEFLRFSAPAYIRRGTRATRPNRRVAYGALKRIARNLKGL